jgi:hypothetical protein
MNGITFDVPLWMLLSAIATVVLPILVGLVTTRDTDPARKAVLLAFLALVAQLLIEVADALQHETPYNLGLALLLGIGQFIGAVAMHYGILKPTRTADWAADHGVTNGRHEAP